MKINYTELKADLLVPHPVTGAFSGNNVAAAAETNVLNLPIEGGVSEMLLYCLKNRSRTTIEATAEKDPTSLMGRLVTVANAVAGTDPLVSGHNLLVTEITNAKGFVTLLTSPHVNTIDFTNAEVDEMYVSMEDAKVWKAPDTTALKGISLNKQSWATLHGYPILDADNIAEAEAQP